MGLATIHPHSQKEHTENHKIPKFGVNQASFGRESDLKASKLTKKCIAIRAQCPDSVRKAKHFFVNFDIFEWLCLAYYWVYLHQT